MRAFPGKGVRDVVNHRPSMASTHFVMIFDRSEIGQESLGQCLRDKQTYSDILKEGVSYWKTTDDDFLTVMLSEHGVPFVSSAKNMSQLIDVVMPEVCLRISDEDGRTTFAAVVGQDQCIEISTRLEAFLDNFDVSEVQDAASWDEVQLKHLYIHREYAILVKEMGVQANEEWEASRDDLGDPETKAFKLPNGDLKVCCELPEGSFLEVTVPAFMWQPVSLHVAKALSEKAATNSFTH